MGSFDRVHVIAGQNSGSFSFDCRDLQCSPSISFGVDVEALKEKQEPLSGSIFDNRTPAISSSYSWQAIASDMML